MHDHRDGAHALLRVTVGVALVIYGLTSPPAMIPFAEVVFGTLLALGLFTSAAAGIAAAAVLIVIAGSALDGQRAAVAHNLSIAVAIFAVYYTADRNRWSIDGMWARRKSAQPERPTTMLRLHTSDEDLVVGVLPANRNEKERLFVARAADVPAAPPASPRHQRKQRQAV